MSDVIEISYTGDILSHRRCPRAWSYDRYAGFQPYEQVQVLEGRLLHHALEWLTRQHHEVLGGRGHPSRADLKARLERHAKVLRSRGMRTRFSTQEETIERILGNLMRGEHLRREVRAAVEGAKHTEYELRSVRRVMPLEFDGKDRILLTGVIDLVVQQRDPLEYARVWEWTDPATLAGQIREKRVRAQTDQQEIWDHKGTRASSSYVQDYARQVLTYAALYRERTGTLPTRCVLFFANEPDAEKRLLAVEVHESLLDAALEWTQQQVRTLQGTQRAFEGDPGSVEGGSIYLRHLPVAKQVDDDLRQQCTVCGYRFDCHAYRTLLTSKGGRGSQGDLDLLNVRKN